MSGSNVVFASVPVDSGTGVELLNAYAAEIADMYDGADLAAPGMPTAGPAEFSAPTGAFLVGYDGPAGPAVCCGALKRLEDGTAEIKRMYVVPSARRRGIARVLLHTLEATALDRGYTVIRMDTGAKHQHAVAFYEAEGYAPVADYNGNPLAVWWGEKRFRR